MPHALRRIPLEGWCDPAEAFRALYGGNANAFWLDSGSDAVAGRSWMGAARDRVLRASVSDGTVSIAEPDGGVVEVRRATVFDVLRGQFDGVVPAPDRASGFHLGWVGWLGYELGRQTCGVELAVADGPDAALLWIDRALEFDHDEHVMAVLVMADDPEADAWAADVAAALRAATPGHEVADAPTGRTARWRHSPEEYERLIGRCQAAITAGDAYQLCLTNTISIDGPGTDAAAALDVYLRLRASSPTHHGGFLRVGDWALASATPEQFLRVDPDRRVVTKPIKGTRPRGASVVRDIELRAELEASDKEQAENLMIVDLMRNDLGRIAELGSVSVTSLLAVESYAHVHQLVSTVEARLAEGLTAIDAVEACFPAGSMTGAPKISAMRILTELEAGPRGVYSGAFGHLGADGTADLAMVIRSIVFSPQGATIGTGGGITALSVPAEEVEETRVKARALLAALGVDA